MTIVATFDVSDVFVEDWAQINCWSEHNINYSSFKPKILCFFPVWHKGTDRYCVSFVIIYLYESNEQKTLESKASYLELKRYQTYIHLLKQRRVRRGYLQLFSTQTVVTSTEPEAVSHKIVARHVVPHPDLKGIGPQKRNQFLRMWDFCVGCGFLPSDNMCLRNSCWRLTAQ